MRREGIFVSPSAVHADVHILSENGSMLLERKVAHDCIRMVSSILW